MKIGIYGSGAVGCYIGGRLAATNTDITFLCRPRMYTLLNEYGLQLSDYKSYYKALNPKDLNLTTQSNDLTEMDYIFICVKSASTEDVANELRKLNLKDTILISFQNSVSNVPLLKRILPDLTILEGMVPYNIAMQDTGHLHQGTDGILRVKAFAQQNVLADMFKRAGLDIQFEKDMLSVQWGKLLLNLNNPINALSKLPLRQQLSIRKYRECLAMAQTEALALLKLSNITPAKLTAISPSLIPYVLSLPNFLFKVLSRKMLKVDPLARSSMQDDLLAGRATEVDWINGEVIRLAEQLGKLAPVNEHLLELIKKAEKSTFEQGIEANSLYKALSQYRE